MANFIKMAADNPGKYPKRMGMKWDESEVLQLLEEVQSQKDIDEIAGLHQRTPGAILAELRRLAYEYWLYDGKPIEEIAEITGLAANDINATIKKRTAAKDAKVKKVAKPEEYLTVLKEIRDALLAISAKLG